MALVAALALAACLHAEPYRLGEGDVIDVIVVGEPELSSGPEGLLVGPDGRIAIPHAGALQAAGKTCDEVAQLVGEALAGRVVIDPLVTVRVQRYNQGVSVLGYVANPGVVPLRTGAAPLSEILSSAGGILPAAGNAQRVVITRANGEVVEANVLKAVEGDPAADLPVGPGDRVYVPRTELEVNVLGFVRTPGRYTAHEGDRVSHLVARAGGPLAGRTSGQPEGDPETVMLMRAVLMRADGATQTLDYATARGGAELDATDPLVLPGDSIYIPDVRLGVSVLGHVQTPGKLLLSPGDRVSDALAAAGGPLRPTRSPADVSRADLKGTRLYRTSGDVIPLDLTVLYENAAEFSDLVLEDGDVIVVPEGNFRVLVSGYVRDPGQFEYRPGDRLSTALTLAGGILPSVGSENAVAVRHADGTQEVVDSQTADPELQPGDVITVPFARERVTVVGFVKQPGRYEWHEGDTVVDMIAMAGGPTAPDNTTSFHVERGSARRAILLRSEGDEDQVYQIDLERFYKRADRSANPPVQAGDVILVPRKQKFDFESLTRDLFVLPSLLN